MRKVKSRYKPKGYWLDQTNRRAVFCEFAKECGFDPFDAANWNSITTAKLVAQKVFLSIFLYFIFFPCYFFCSLSN